MPNAIEAVQIFRQLAERYAQSVDARDASGLAQLVTADIAIEGPGFVLTGRDEVLAIPAMLDERFRTTRHLIHNQIVEVDDDVANGETLCTASHLLKDSDEVLDWHIRYQDSFRKQDGQWRFSHRKLIIDWTETRKVDLPE